MPLITSPIKEWVRGAKLVYRGFAPVYVGINKPNMKRFAVKSVDHNDKEKRLMLENEKKALKTCDSKYIVQYLGCATTKNVDLKMVSINLFMELVPRGTVLDHITRNGGSLEEPIVATYTRDILRALKHIHEHGIVHGNIKCANFLVAPKNIKLWDFGSAKFLKDGNVDLPPKPDVYPKRRRIFVTGSEGWMAPEVQDEIQQGPPSDIYSLGCSVVEMCTGHPPQKDPIIYAFENFGDSDVDDNNDFPQCTVDVPPNYSEGCREFVEWTLALDPDDRPSAAELLDHSWIKNAPPYPEQSTPMQSPRFKSFIPFSNVFGCGTSTNDVTSQRTPARR